MPNSVNVTIGGQFDGLVSALQGAQSQLEGFLSPISAIGDALTGIGEVMTVAFAVEKLASFVSKMSELGASVERATQELGMSAEKVSTLNTAFDAMGVGADNGARMLERLERNMVEAQLNAGPAREAFQAVGISLGDLKSMSPDEVLNRLAEAFSRNKDLPNKTAIAIALLDRAGAKMIPVLDQGSAGLAKFRQIAIDTGTVITGPMAAGMEKSAVEGKTLDDAFLGVGITLYEAFKPAIDVVVTGLTNLVEGFNNGIKTGGNFNIALEAIVIAVDLAVAAVETFVNGLRQLWDVGETALFDLSQAWTTLGTVMMDVVTLSFSRVTSDFAAGWAKMAQITVTGFQKIKDTGAQEIADMKALFSNIGLGGVDTSGASGGGGTTGGKGQLPAMGAPAGAGGIGGSPAQQQSLISGWKDTLQQQLMDQNEFFKSSSAEELAYWQSKLQTVAQYEAMYGLSDKEAAALHLQVQTEIYNLDKQAAQTWLTDYMAGLDQQLAALKDDYSEKRITDKQYYDDSIALEQNRQLVLKQLGLDGTADYEKSISAIDALEKEHAAESEKTWNSLFNTIDNAMDQMLTGILRGTQTWQQAITKLFDNMAISFIEDLAKMSVKWAAFEALGVGSNPFSGVASAIGGMIGGGGGNSGANNATQLLTTAIQGQTAATTANTGGILQSIVGWAENLLGITTSTTATTASAVATTTATATQGGLIGALTALLTTGIIPLTTAVWALDVATWADATLPKYDVGSWSVPHDMAAIIHKDEMIIPAGPAAALRAGGSQSAAFAGGSPGAPFASGSTGESGAGAGLTVVFAPNISAMDGQSVANVLKNQGPTIATVIAGQIRNAHSGLTAAIKAAS